MSTIKRYEGACDSFGMNLMEEDPVGEYVLFSDHEAEVEKYKSLLLKYIEHVLDCEGTTFIDSSVDYAVEYGILSREEDQMLVEMDTEIRKSR